MLCLLAVLTSQARETNKDDKDYVTGKEYYQKQDYDNARFYLLRFTRDNPDHEDALILLMNIEERTGHYATAITHANEILALNPYNSHFWLKKIGYYRKLGNDIEADRLLERICVIYPEVDSLQMRLRARNEEKEMELYKSQRENGDVEGQIESLRKFIRQAQMPGSGYSKAELSTYYSSLANLLLGQGRTGEALDVISMGLNAQPGNVQLVKKKVGILSEQGRTMEAYVFLKNIMAKHKNPTFSTMLRDLEDMLTVQSQLNDSYTMFGRKWESSRDTEALRHLISTSISRGYLDDAQQYLKEARKIYGDTPELIYKSYMVEKRLGNEGRALDLLRKMHAMQPDNQEVTDLLAVDALHTAADYITDLRYADAVLMLDSVIAMQPDEDIVLSARAKKRVCQAYYDDKAQKKQLEDWERLVPKLYHQGLTDEMLLVADSALAVDSTLETMIYYKGLAYERKHDWAEAYKWLRKYKPSPLEIPEYRRHLNSLLAHNYVNDLTFDYQLARLGLVDRLTANASVTYVRQLRSKDVITSLIQYTPRDDASGEDGTYKGGVGVQLGAGYKHIFSQKFSGELFGAWSNRFFPVATVRATGEWQVRKEWSVMARASYRLTDSYHHSADNILQGHKTSIFNLGGAFGKDINQFHITGGTDLFLIKDNVYFNINAKAQYFPLEHSRTHVFASAGAGTAPEVEIIDNSLPTGFSSVNTFVAAGGFYSINSHLGMALSGSWYNLLDSNKVHRNYLYGNVQIQISF